MRLLARLVEFRSKTASIVFCILVSCLVLGCSLVLQWLVYDDWLHETGPIHIFGSGLAAALTFTLVYERQKRIRERDERMQRHFQAIADMNDRIRNALQAIECSTYVSNPRATEPVRASVDAIEAVLRQALATFPRPSAAVTTIKPEDPVERVSSKSA